MLTIQNAHTLREIKVRALQLSSQPKGAGLGRALRRFFEQYSVVEPHGPRTLAQVQADPSPLSRVIVQVFSSSRMGYTKKQLRVIARYRAEMHGKQLAVIPAPTVSQCPIADLGSYNHPADMRQTYVLEKNIAEMTVAELQAVAKFVVVLCETLEVLLPNGPSTILFGDTADYVYRGLPCSIASDEKLWCVSGLDERTGGSGVLEWCYDEADAKDRLAAMKQFPERFPEIKAEPFTQFAAPLSEELA